MDQLRYSSVRDIFSAKVDNVAGRSDALSDRSAKEIYFGLLQPRPEQATVAQSRRFLAEQLHGVASDPTDIPADADDLLRWMKSNTAAVGEQYRHYLAGRHSGGARRYFPTKSHALHFLTAVAPTKLVDGAWLYGLVSQWRDLRYAELIRIYLEELGEGEADKNHVVIYRKLLARHECAHWSALDPRYSTQGAIQLALGQHAREFLPEVIGFNLGYEQLPLHLLICAYELNELGIDPYYFTLHITIDNAASGHAARAVQAVTDAMPQLGDREAFYQRVRNGYQLNALGVSTNDVIADFDLDQELLDVLASKAMGAQLHSDYCRVAGKTVNEWLAEPDRIGAFVEALEKIGWIRRHEDPANSRFWNLLEGDKAPMFGVFNAYERQVIYDWIAGDSVQRSNARTRPMNPGRIASVPSSYAEQRLVPRSGQEPWGAEPRTRYRNTGGARRLDDFSAESRLLDDRLAKAADQDAAMDLLAPWLSPVHHHTEVGLRATRMFSQLLRT